MPKDWDIDKEGRVWAYGTLWNPIRPHAGRSTIMPRPRYDIEMTCYRFLRGLETPKGFTRPPGIQDAFHHFKAICIELWGKEDSMFPWEWNPNAERMLRIKLEKTFLMIGGHKSSGKSEFLVVWGIVNFLASPKNTKVLITSVSLKSAKTKIWGSVSLAWQQAGRTMSNIYGVTAKDGESLLPGKLMANGLIRWETNGYNTDKYGLELIAGDADGASQNTPKIQGTKAKYLYVELDELSELDHGLMNTIISNLFKSDKEENEVTDVTGAFNPNSHFDPAGKECEPYWSEEKKGWTHVDTTMTEWPIRRGWFIRFDGATSPNVLLGVEKWKGLLTKTTYDSFIEQNGTKSKEYWQMYAAFWSPTGSVECIYDENELSRAMNPVTKEWISPATPCAFMDPSFAHGGDGAAMAFGLCGEARIEGKNIRVLSITEVLGLDAQIDARQDKPTQVSRLFISECQKRGVSPQNAGLDTTGAGMVLYSLIAKDWAPNILKVGFGDSASDKPISRIDNTPAKEKYVRMVSEIWYSGKPLIRSGQIRGLPADVCIEMCARTYETINGKIKVESKEDMKLRALRSPDCFIAGTMVTTDRGDVEIQDVQVGDMVATPFGYSPVLMTHEVEAIDITSLEFEDGKVLTGTSGHKIFTRENGWQTLSSVKLDTYMESVYNRGLWNILNSLFTKVENTDFKILVDTIKTRTGAAARRDFFTESSGLSTMGLFLKACASTIKITIGQIIGSKIWNSSLRKNTCGIMPLRTGMIQMLPSKCAKVLREQDSLHQSGTLHQKDMSGTKPTLQTLLENLDKSELNHALSAVLDLKPRELSASPSIVLSSVPPEGGHQEKGILGRVFSAALSSLVYLIIRPRPVVTNVQVLSGGPSRNVYNLTLLEDNVYYANGVLVQNCADAALGLAHLCRQRLGLVAEERSAGSLTGRAYRKGSVVAKVAKKISSCIRPTINYQNGNALWKK